MPVWIWFYRLLPPTWIFWGKFKDLWPIFAVMILNFWKIWWIRFLNSWSVKGWRAREFWLCNKKWTNSLQVFGFWLSKYIEVDQNFFRLWSFQRGLRAFGISWNIDCDLTRFCIKVLLANRKPSQLRLPRIASIENCVKEFNAIFWCVDFLNLGAFFKISDLHR